MLGVIKPLSILYLPTTVSLLNLAMLLSPNATLYVLVAIPEPNDIEPSEEAIAPLPKAKLKLPVDWDDAPPAKVLKPVACVPSPIANELSPVAITALPKANELLPLAKVFTPPANELLADEVVFWPIAKVLVPIAPLGVPLTEEKDKSVASNPILP